MIGYKFGKFYRALTLHPKVTISVFGLIIMLSFAGYFASQLLLTPKVVDAGASSNQKEVLLSDSFQINFNRPVQRDEVRLTLEPTTDGTIVWKDSLLNSHFYKTAVFEPSQSFLPSTTYKVAISDIKNASGIGSSISENVEFTTQPIPTITNVSIADNQEIEKTAEINFTLDSTNDGIAEFDFDTTPAVELTSVLSDDKLSYKVTSKNGYGDGTKYLLTATRAQVIKDSEGNPISTGAFEKNFEINFTTKAGVQVPTGPVAPRVISTSPKNKAGGIAQNATISVTFDQEVNHQEAENSFSSTSGVGTFAWQGTKMIFTPQNPFDTDASYTATVKAGVTAANGLKLASNYSFSFSTVQSQVLLNIATDHQDKALSCEIASLKMALAGKGVSVSEDEITNIIGFDPTIRSGNVWGDPYTAFVGDINGHQNTTGYGVYWDPIAKAANHWRSATAFSGWTPAQLASEIQKGNPVVIWGTYGKGAYRDDWVTPSGKQIVAWKGEHARTVVGFKGKADNPSAFIINDPIAGRLTWTTASLKSNWSAFGNSGVVVY